MLLAVDIGNTTTVFGLGGADGAWPVQWRISTPKSAIADDWAALILPLAARDGIDFEVVGSVAIGSVVPVVTAGIVQFLTRSLEVAPLMVRSDLDLGIGLGMDNPQEVGVDRLANAAAAWAYCRAPVIVVDLGTATKVEAIDGSGTFLGGAIAPGLGVSLEAMTSRAARLFSVDLTGPPSSIGRNTVAAVQAGLVRGHLHMIRGLIADISTELGGQAAVIVTGGHVSAVLPTFGQPVIHQPDLTLDGIRLIHSRNQTLAT